MTIYNINPNINIISNNNITNIMGQLSKEISILANKYTNIVDITTYNLLINSIFQIVKNRINIYNFIDDNNIKISNIFIEIYNQNLIPVINMNFILSNYYFTYTYNNWNNFILYSYNNKNNVYNSISQDEKNKLEYSIISGDFYFKDNINVTVNSLIPPTIGLGLITKSKLCNCISNTCIPYTLIIGLYWY